MQRSPYFLYALAEAEIQVKAARQNGNIMKIPPEMRGFCLTIGNELIAVMPKPQ